MRDAIAILASSSITLPPNSTPSPATTTPSNQQSLSPASKSKSKKFSGRKQSLKSTAALLHSTVRWNTSPSRQVHRLKDYAELASDLAEDGRFSDLLMIAESVVVSGAKPSQFLAMLNLKSVSAGISRMLEDGKLERLIEVLSGLLKLGFPVVKLFDGVAFESLRQECLRRFQNCVQPEEIVSLMETLQGLGFSPNQLLASSQVIKLCVKRRSPGAAIRYAQLFPQMETLLCTVMIEFGKKRDLVSALNVFEVSKRSQGSPNTYAYRTIIDVCGLCGDSMKSRSIYEELLSCKFTPNIYVFNSLMNVNANDLSFTLRIYKQMQRFGVTADLASYNILLKSCCLAAKVELALDIYRQTKYLESTGDLKLDVFTYSTMIKVLADARMWKMALEIKEDMLSAGVTPNAITWLSLISACANAGLAEQSIRLFEEMLQAGCEPNSQCCNILLHACVEARQYDRAFRLFRSWKENGIQPVSTDFKLKTHNIISADCSRDGFSALSDSPVTSEVQYHTKRLSFAPTTATYNILMKACGTNYRRAKALMDEMKTEGLSPNRISWSILMDIYGGLGNVKGALQILRSMHQAGIQPDVVTYTTAIKACVEHKHLEVAFSLLSEMRRYQIKPNMVTYDTLLRARSQYGSLHQVQQCLAIYRDMRKAGYKPNDYYLKHLIEEWCEGVIQNRTQNKGQFTPIDDTADSGPQSLLLDKVAEHLKVGNVESLSIDLRGLSRIEARIVVLAVLRMIKEKYSTGNMVEDDLWIITEGISGAGTSKNSSGITELITKLLENDLGLEVLSAGSRESSNIESDSELLSVSSTEIKEVLKQSDLPLKLDSPSRRPAVLLRLKVTKASLHSWLQRKGVSVSE
ncbi:OLC1v1034679C1 [Oldenlandia corymbosa var. corymbosa]|uniref:OLC1v1034679C1 n=1 Tax=Oldenlandia corymbosa var. corymbosa TaxID=529605 RepID=A0AAV1CRA5_OLDCO|nr:OLC1v1034679C1 [Oldenlandia corymbosa var. corymbosa]